MNDFRPIQRALLSVWDKSGLKELATALRAKDVELYSTGGTAKYLQEECGLPVTLVEQVTKFPEMMAGRVKTLHPKIFGGLLARREEPSDLKEASDHDIPLLDLVVCNLYPFWEKLGQDPQAQSSLVDIGGPSMIRAASKNHAAVMVLSHTDDYSSFINTFNATGGTTLLDRRTAAAKTFSRTSQYDAQIASQWSEGSDFPSNLSLGSFEMLRYGENPHQKAVYSGQKSWKLLQGKALSYNNLLDTQAALGITQDFKNQAVAIIKHNNPCGAAAGEGSLATVFDKALACDSQSAFGGIVSTNQVVDKTTAEKMSGLFLEVIIAKGFEPKALEVLSKKKNLRLIEWENPQEAAFEIRKALGGWLLQDSDADQIDWSQLKVVTDAQPSDATWKDIQFAWTICKHVRSNAIVLAKQQATIGIGAGQMSRVDAVKLSLEKCVSQSPCGSVLASDAFFPFRDNIDLLKGREIAAIVQPGGSKRDGEVIEACNELKIPMVFTGKRHFRH